MANDLQQTATFNYVLNAVGTEKAKEASVAVRDLNKATDEAGESMGKFSKSTTGALTQINKVQNAFFRAAFYASRLAGSNSVLAQSLTSIAFGADVAITSLQAFIAVSNALRVAKAGEAVASTAAGVAATGPAAPILGPAIVAAVIGAAAAVLAFLSQTPSAAFGGVFDKPTLARVGDSPFGDEIVSSVAMLRAALGTDGGTERTILEVDGKNMESSLTRRKRISERRGL